jgi:amino acid permease
LTIPYTFETLGLGFGLIIILILLIISINSSKWLIESTEEVEGNEISYIDLTINLLGEKMGKLLINISIFLYQIGSLVAYIIISSDLVYLYVSKIYLMDKRLLTFTVSALVMYPLANLKNINSLRITSFISLFFVLCNVVIVVIKSIPSKKKQKYFFFIILKINFSFTSNFFPTLGLQRNCFFQI